MSLSSPDLAPRTTRLAPSDAAIFETFVVPRYLSLFGELALESVVETDAAEVVHFGCRTGYPDRPLSLRLSDARIVGLGAAAAALLAKLPLIVVVLAAAAATALTRALT